MSFYKYLTQFNLVPIVIISQDPSCEAWALFDPGSRVHIIFSWPGSRSLRYFEYYYGKG